MARVATRGGEARHAAALGVHKGVVMRKPFTVIAALLLLLVAAVHVYRALTGMELVVNGQDVPMMVSYIAAAITGLVGLLTLMELRK